MHATPPHFFVSVLGTPLETAPVRVHTRTMPKRLSRPIDINKLAASIVASVTQEPARAAKLSKKRRAEIAKKAAQARWGK